MIEKHKRTANHIIYINTMNALNLCNNMYILYSIQIEIYFIVFEHLQKAKYFVNI